MRTFVETDIDYNIRIANSNMNTKKRFAKTRSSHEVRSLGLGGVPNEPVQKLAQVWICTLLAKQQTAIRTLLANLQNLYG